MRLRQFALAAGIFTVICSTGAVDAWADANATYWAAFDRACRGGDAAQLASHQTALAAELAQASTRTDLWLSPYSGVPAQRRPQLLRSNGRTTNFWGPRSPEHALADCVQAR